MYLGIHAIALQKGYGSRLYIELLNVYFERYVSNVFLWNSSNIYLYKYFAIKENNIDSVLI